MTARLLAREPVPDVPGDFLTRAGRVFAAFDQRTQDSGNVSYGVEEAGCRYFVKTAGAPGAQAFLGHAERVRWLRNAVRVAGAVVDPVLVPLLNVIESAHGPMLVYEWVDGELVGVPRERRSDPTRAFARFKALPLPEVVAALDAVLRVHAALGAAGWVASDFYDGAMIYDFDAQRLHLVDLDQYRDAPFVNDMGRMFGSTRFMAPEEFELGARIDERTTVFVMGRCLDVFVGERNLEPVAAIVSRACAPDASDRFESTAELHRAWTRFARAVAAR